MLREQNVQVHDIIIFSPRLFFFVNSFLFLDSVAIFDELIIEFVLDKAVHDAGTDNVVTSRNLIAHAPRCHQLDYNRLWRLDPLRFEFLITDTIEEHRFFVGAIRCLLSLYDFQITLIVGDNLPDFTVETSVELRDGKFSLARLDLLHLFELCEFLTDDLRAEGQAGRYTLLLLE